MTQTVTLPNGDTIDFPDDMPPEALNAAVSRHIAATSSGATPAADAQGGWRSWLPDVFSKPALNAQGQPEYLDDPNVTSNAIAGDKLVARSLLRAHPALAIPNAVAVATQQGLNAVSGKLGGPTNEVWNPLESGIHALGLDIDPNASPEMKTADAALPWLIPSGNQLGRVGEAGGLYNKAMTFGRSEGMNLASWMASDAAQKWAQEHGFGPLATTIAGFVGGAGPNVAAHYAGPPVARTIIPPKEDAGAKFDVNKNLLPPDGSTVAPVPPLRDVADPNSSASSFLSGAGSLPYSGSGQAGAVNAQTRAIAKTADAGLQALDKGTTPVLKAGPASLGAESSRLAEQAREKIMGGEKNLIAESNAIDGQLADTRVDATVLRQTIADLTDPKKVGATVAGHALPILQKFDDSMAADGTVPYDVLKTERSNLKEQLSGMMTAPTGAPTVSRSVAAKLAPIEDAMTERMGAAADSVSPQLGSQWRANDARWTQHSKDKRNLSDVGGTLTPDRSRFDPSPGAADVSNVLTKAVAGRGGTSPIIDIEQGLGEQPARSAVAETVAAMGRPKNARGTQDFRPDLFGEGQQARVDPVIMNWIEQHAGQEARQNIENAATAGAATSAPARPGGWSKAFGGVLAAAPFAGPAAVALGHMATPFTPLVQALISAGHDPDLIRSIAGRNVPISALGPQIGVHGALGVRPNAVDPLQALHLGLSDTLGAVPSLLKRLSVQGGQR